MLMHSLANHKEGDDTNINQISEQTGIRSEDLISTLQSLDMIKVRLSVSKRKQLLTQYILPRCGKDNMLSMCSKV